MRCPHAAPSPAGRVLWGDLSVRRVVWRHGNMVEGPGLSYLALPGACSGTPYSYGRRDMSVYKEGHEGLTAAK